MLESYLHGKNPCLSLFLSLSISLSLSSTIVCVLSSILLFPPSLPCTLSAVRTKTPEYLCFQTPPYLSQPFSVTGTQKLSVAAVMEL